MFLKDLIDELERHDPAKTVAIGFHDPDSYRGDYAQVAFALKRNTTVGDMLKAARSALGRTFSGYKGGEYTMDEWTTVYLAEWGSCGEEIGPVLLAFMLGDPICTEQQESRP